jgi:two-component system, cell cycle sensor histidine kinase and response regulator CckA
MEESGNVRRTLRTLIVEDCESDALLVVRELERAGYEPVFKRIDTREEMLRALESDAWDVIICDHAMPSFNSLAALNLYKEKDLDIPFIIVSGTIGEAVAVEAMLAGAHDFVLKQKLSRLAPALARELKQTDVRREGNAMERALRESERRYRELAALLPAIVAESDEKGTLTFLNRRGLEVLGYSEDDFDKGIEVIQLIHPDEHGRLRDNLKKRALGDGTGNEYTMVKRDGSTFPILIYSSPIILGSGPAGWRSVAVDITKQKEAEEEREGLEAQLRHAQKMEAVGTLAGGIAHDFNNILTVLGGFASLLQIGMEKSNPMQLYVDQIVSAAEKAASLTQGLLIFSRQQHVSFFPIALNDLVMETEKLLKRLLTEDIRLETLLSTEEITIMADKTQIDQILFNLVTNSRDAMQNGGVLTIETKLVGSDKVPGEFRESGWQGHYALLSVTDTGTGIDDDTKAKIFDPFFTTKGVGKGTGLGLATVYGIVKQHKGCVEVLGEPGEGTTFNIYFPTAAERVAEEEKAPVEIRAGKGTILVAEDDEGVRRFLREILRRYGYVVIEAEDGEEAVERFRQHDHIDLLILDTVMPRKNGKEALSEIQGLVPAVKVIFTSGYAADTVLDKGVEDGEVEFIRKPIKVEELLGKVNSMIGE